MKIMTLTKSDDVRALKMKIKKFMKIRNSFITTHQVVQMIQRLR